MKKIPTVFVRDHDTHKVIDQVTPGCEWVLNGEGIATRKWDGTCVLVNDIGLFRRREVKPGKPDPTGFVLSEHDPNTGKRFGWLQVGEDGDDRWIREAFWNTRGHAHLAAGPYEAVGPKINGNHDQQPEHVLKRHGDVTAEWVGRPHGRTFGDMRTDLQRLSDWEGLVFHHSDGRRAKIKRKDFGSEKA